MSEVSVGLGVSAFLSRIILISHFKIVYLNVNSN